MLDKGLTLILDLSAAFDIVNVKLLLKRLRIVGLSEALIELIDKWLSTQIMVEAYS